MSVSGETNHANTAKFKKGAEIRNEFYDEVGVWHSNF